jgi:hypothetical protein
VGIKNLTRYNISLFLIIFLSFDVLFISIHLINALLLTSSNSFFYLEQERSISEIYQYIKHAGIISLLFLIILKIKYFHYFSLIIFFTIVLADDSLQIHEKFGENFNLMIDSPALSEHLARNLGELFGFLMLGALALIPLAISFIKSNYFFKKFLTQILFLVAILIFFGVVIDSFSMLFTHSPQISFLYSLLEESGEIFTTSFILYFVFAHFKSIYS